MTGSNLKHWISKKRKHCISKGTQNLLICTDSASTPSTMRKPFLKHAPKLLCGFADPWATCSDEEKVQLLSVLGLGSESSSNSSVSTQSTTPTVHHNCEGQENLGPIEDDLPCDPQVDTSMNFSDSFLQNDQSSINKDGQQQLEWIFTLYDFDRKGRVTKADIASLVRSIYEVLGTTKIALNKGEGPKSNEGCTSAFKIKLTVLAGENCTVTSDPNANLPSKQEIEIGTPKMGVKRRSLTFPPPVHAPLPSRKQVCLHEQPNLCIPNCSKRPRHHPNNENSPRKHNTVPMSQSWPTKTAPTKKVEKSCVAYRDYVNLSELEACCSAGLHQPYPGVHHIRHCDRHCSCDNHKNCQEGTVQCCKTACHPSPRISPKVSKEKVDSEKFSPPSTHFFEGSCSTMHARKHRNRDRERQRAMQLVQDWIVKEGKHSDGVHSSHVVRKVVQHEHVHHHHHYIHPT